MRPTTQKSKIVVSRLFSSSGSYHTLQNYGIIDLQDHGNNDSVLSNVSVELALILFLSWKKYEGIFSNVYTGYGINWTFKPSTHILTLPCYKNIGLLRTEKFLTYYSSNCHQREEPICKTLEEPVLAT